MNRSAYLLPIALVPLLAVACSAPLEQADSSTHLPDRPTGVIVGTLRDASGTGLPRQQVTLATEAVVDSLSVDRFAGSTSGGSVAYTNERGQFAFDVTAAGTYTLTNLAETTGAHAVVVVQRAADGSLVSGSEIDLAALELGAVSGRVVDRGAGVLAFLAGTSFMALTDATGAFTIGRVPAGTYEVVAGVASAIGTPVPVSISPGEVVVLSYDLHVGPSISHVSPDGLVFLDTADVYEGLLPNFTIAGSGFGARQGLSIVRFAGITLNSSSIISWSDSLIEIRGAGVSTSIAGDIGYDPIGTTVADLRFSIIGAGGESSSGPAGAVWMEAYRSPSGEMDSLEEHVYAMLLSFGWIHVGGASIGVSVTNGIVLALESEEEVATYVSRAAYEPSFRIRANGALPTVMTVDPSFDDAFEGTQPQRYHGNPGFISLASNVFSTGSNTLTGEIVPGNAAGPMPDDGRFTIRIQDYDGYFGGEELGDPAEAMLLTLAADGSFSLDFDAAEEVTQVVVDVLYDDVRMDTTFLYLAQ